MFETPITLQEAVFRSRWQIPLSLTILGAILGLNEAQAASPPVPTPEVFYSRIEPLTDTIGRVESDPRPKTADGALQVLDWLLYPNLTTGGAYDSNYFSSSTNPTSVYGARFQPSLIAVRNTGIQRTTVYGIGDVRYYPSIGRTNIVDTTGGLVHVWEIQRDLVFRMQGQLSVGDESSGLSSLFNGRNAVDPVRYYKLFGSASIEKSFGNFFTAVGGSITNLTYENSKDQFGNTVDETFRNGDIYTLNTRLGYHVTPIVYVYTEPSINAQRYSRSSLDSSGHQVKVGVGSDRIGLMNGELYSGYRQQQFSDPTIPELSGGIFGGRLSYYPTRFITVTTAYDQTLGTSDFGASSLSSGTVTKVNTARLNGSWEVTRKWTLTGKIEYSEIDYINSFRSDQITRYGAGIIYMINPLFGLSVDFTNQKVDSSLAGADYSRNFVGFGAVTKF